MSIIIISNQLVQKEERGKNKPDVDRLFIIEFILSSSRTLQK